MGAAEIVYLIELNKKRAELKFKRDYLIRKGKAVDDPQVARLGAELENISKQADELESKITTKEALFYPNEKLISELNAEVAKLAPEKIDQAMLSKAGDEYALLEKRGKLLKDNYERRKEIATLMEFANSLPSKIRDEIIEKTKLGSIGELDASILDEKARARLFKLLNRAGIRCVLDQYRLLNEGQSATQWNEKRLEVEGNIVWTDGTKDNEIADFFRQMTETGNRIQVMNAERHVKTFTPEEETQFFELQKKYLDMLKKRNEMLSE